MTNQTTGRSGLPCLINSHKKQFLKVIRYGLISAPVYPGKTKGYFNGNSRLLRLKQKGISRRRNASGKNRYPDRRVPVHGTDGEGHNR